MLLDNHRGRCVNQGLHSQFATDERGHLPLEFIRPGYSQKNAVSGRALTNIRPMKFLIRIILPFTLSALLGFWLYFKLIEYGIPFKEDKTINSIFVIVLSISLIIFIVNAYFFSNRCKSCKEWNALEIISKEVIDKKPSHIMKTLNEKNSKGEVIRTKEVTVPSTKYTYLIHKKCIFCEEVTKYTEEENIEN